MLITPNQLLAQLLAQQPRRPRADRDPRRQVKLLQFLAFLANYLFKIFLGKKYEYIYI